jgi:16S rRNA (cytidine1402-2'-O)-methyltransferase
MSLYIVATPIGNLGDITLRALKVLKDVDLVLAEDTRRTSNLLNHYDIKEKKLVSYNDHNKERKTTGIIKLLIENKDIAIVSDSGTPGISDPGFYLVRECVRNSVEIVSIPGPSSIISALVGSGLPTDKFTFLGFLPKKEKKKKDMINQFKDLKETLIFFESPHRIKNTLELMNEMIPEHKLAVARELTKKFEEFIRGSVKEVYEILKGREVKGEIVIVVRK